MKLHHIRLSARLGLGFGVVLLLVLAMALAGSWALRHLSALNERDTALAEQLRLLTEWEAQTEMNLGRTQVLVKAGGATPMLQNLLGDPIKATSARITGLREQIDKLDLDASTRALLDTVAARRKSYVGVRDTLLARLKQGEAEAVSEDADKLLAPAAKSYMDSMTATKAHLAEQLQQQLVAQAASVNRSRWLLVGLALLALLLGSGLSWVITRSVVVPLQAAITASHRIASGDLSQPLALDRRDELGDLGNALDAMTRQLSQSLRGVLESSETINHASREVASGSADLSARTEQAAGSLQDSASSIEQLSGTVRSSAEAAQQARVLAARASDVAQRGGVTVGQVVSTMDAINASSRQIADIVGTIDGIAFQTNILALNAAVEAARAGEQGRGFAVVASEVRTLAQRSAAAAREIKSLIAASVERVEAGSRQVNDAGSTMNDIVASVQRVNDIISEISSAAVEQSQGIALVSASVNDIDGMTQQNAALVEQSAAAAESLKDQARRLGTLVAAFRLQAA